MSGWDDTETILVGDRRMRVRRRRPPRLRINAWVAFAVVIVLAVVGVGVYLYVNRPEGLQAVEGPAVVAPGGFQAKVGGEDTITVALEIRNVTDEAVTVLGARVVPPAGLRQVSLSVLQPGEQNRNLILDGGLPPSTPVTLGTSGVDRNAVVAARFRVDCENLPTAGATGEQIFVTVRLGADQREEQLIPPVVGGVPWLTATARSACVQPSATGGIPTPLPPLPPSP